MVKLTKSLHFNILCNIKWSERPKEEYFQILPNTFLMKQDKWNDSVLYFLPSKFRFVVICRFYGIIYIKNMPLIWEYLRLKRPRWKIILRYIWVSEYLVHTWYTYMVIRYLNDYKFTSNRLYDDEFNLLSQNMSKLTNAYRSWQHHERECESKRNGIEKNSDSENIWFLLFHFLLFWRFLFFCLFFMVRLTCAVCRICIYLKS